MGNAFGKDSAETKFFESLPVAGYIASAAHAGAGNHEHAKRAAASCTNATITTIGAVAGGLAGGPAGAMAGAAAGKLVGIGSEHGVSKHIDDPTVRANVGSVSAERLVVDTGFSAVGASMGSVASVASQQVSTSAVGSFVAGKAASVAFESVPAHFAQPKK